MTTIILKAPKAMTAPLPGTPKLPDTLTGLTADLNAASLTGLADGATVTSWIASGVAPLVNRTYNFAFTGWGFPTLSLAGGPGGGKAVMFNGSQEICNGAGTVAQAQPVTYAMVVKSSAFASTQARLLASGSQIVAPGNSGYYASGGTRLESGNTATTWQVLVVVFNGDTSKIKMNSSPIINGSTGAAAVGSGRNSLGGQGATLSGVGLNGGIVRLKTWQRALSDSDIEAVSLNLLREYGLV